MKTVHERQLAQPLGYGIGNTPLQAITFSMQGVAHTIHLKLEGFNPTHSMKDRTAYSLVQKLEDQGKLNENSTIVESTSGNLGVAMARLCQLKGYKFLAVVDPKTTAENLAKLQTFGAQVDIVREPDENNGYLLSRLAHIQKIIVDHPDYVWTNQYDNPANPSIHYSSTGPEIYTQMNQKIDAIFVPTSTGGTLAGIGKFFREVLPSTQIIGVDAFGSVIFDTPSAPRKLTGIGSSRRSTFLHKELYDEYVLVKDEEAFAFCRLLFASTGIAVGGSSGAVLTACARYLSQHRYAQHVVCVCADHGDNYRSSIFNDSWLKEQALELLEAHLGNVEQISL
ncbi:2,3-diaminopropionate biosynthesis protein SbnA [Ktedonobacteria bacterium brp13]|nr:2,3-diaminopropionate biosynthesis protein SbnA [Ktedonobacteria bacterium brp13]